MFRYLKLIWEAWAAENERRKKKAQMTDVAFLPAALEILETPVSPAGRAVLWSVVLLSIVTIAWACFGYVDMVAVAEGRIVPRERVKTIQAAELGVVRGIHVQDGSRVKVGDLLIELDPTASGAEEEQAKKSLAVAELELARGRALLAYLDGEPRDLVAPEHADPATVGTQVRLLDSLKREYEAKLASLQQQTVEREADLAVSKSQVKKLRETLSLVNEQVKARRELTEKGLSPRLLYLQIQERQVGLKRDIEIEDRGQEKTGAAMAALDREADRVKEEFQSKVMTDLADAEARVSMGTQQLRKAAQRSGLGRILAPIDGVVQQLGVHTLGGVVEPAQPLLVIVPGSGELVVEALVLNKDIGFVTVGLPVEVKLEAFPFTKYGVIHGVLEDISGDSIQDEQRGPIFHARVKLERQDIDAGGRIVPLSPGMTAAAEIKIGDRRLIEFLLSPLVQARGEAFRER